jgi:hypothetical protein
MIIIEFFSDHFFGQDLPLNNVPVSKVPGMPGGPYESRIPTFRPGNLHRYQEYHQAVTPALEGIIREANCTIPGASHIISSKSFQGYFPLSPRRTALPAARKRQVGLNSGCIPLSPFRSHVFSWIQGVDKNRYQYLSV